MSTNIQLTSFNSHLDSLLARLNALKLNSYIFLDSNLNLLHISTDNNAANYHDLITSNGYLQTITRATRIQHNNFSLIDHILTNSPSTKSQSGILISDISDHFFTFTLPDYHKSTQHPHLTPHETSAMPIFKALETHSGTSLGNPPLTQTMQMIAITHSG
jgi:hypothetical protein